MMNLILVLSIMAVAYGLWKSEYRYVRYGACVIGGCVAYTFIDSISRFLAGIVSPLGAVFYSITYLVVFVGLVLAVVKFVRNQF